MGSNRGRSVVYVFMAFFHPANDSRLYHRQAKSIMQQLPNATVLFALPDKIVTAGTDPCKVGAGSQRVRFASHIPGAAFLLRKLKKLINGFQCVFRVCRLQPTIVQASDPPELKWALLIRLFTGAAVIYDSHEDYVNQALEYPASRIDRWKRLTEVVIGDRILSRMANTISCTDDYLFSLYRRIAPNKQVILLRNFPWAMEMTSRSAQPPIERSWQDDKALDLVYIGSVNAHRGVIQLAEFSDQHNARHGSNIRAHVYAKARPLLDDLSQKYNLIRHDYLDRDSLMTELRQFDVGVCLWQPLRKLSNNLPIKIFEYMMAGIPVLCSDFGNIGKYAKESSAAITIDPTDYSAFEDAISRLRDPQVRRDLGDAGRSFVLLKANWEEESKAYLRAIERMIMKPTG